MKAMKTIMTIQVTIFLLCDVCVETKTKTYLVETTGTDTTEDSLETEDDNFAKTRLTEREDKTADYFSYWKRLLPQTQHVGTVSADIQSAAGKYSSNASYLSALL